MWENDDNPSELGWLYFHLLSDNRIYADVAEQGGRQHLGYVGLEAAHRKVTNIPMGVTDNEGVPRKIIFVGK